MKLKYLTILLIFIFNLKIYAKDLDKGYRGIVEWNMDFGSYDAYRHLNNSALEQYKAHYILYGISTTHGYQFNPHFFLGAGVWIQFGAGDVLHRLEIPIFLQSRTDWTFGKIPLYFDLRLGGTFSGRTIENGDDKLLISPTVGYRLNWGRRVCANFGIGLSLHGCDDGLGRSHFTWHPLPTFRIGIDF